MEQPENKTTPRLGLALLALLIVSASSYYYFATYQPKILKKIEEVKGIKKISTIELLYPENAQIISVSQTKKGSQTSYRTEKSQDYIQVFYKNIFTDLGWDEIFIKESDDSLTYKFKKDESTAIVIAQKEQDKTLVSVEVNNR